MTQEEKQLLLKDLCARIPYHTLVQLNPGAYNKPETCMLTGVHGEKIHLNVDSDPFRINSIRPYLRPMSSMTEEEEEFVYNGHIEFWIREDYCNKHHLDYRGLILMRLALEASEGMYKTE